MRINEIIMTLYIVRAKPKNNLSGLRKELESGKISKLRPFGETLHHGLENSRFDSVIGRFQDLILRPCPIDVRMPDMNGFELYSEIKSKDNKIKVLFLTALRDLHDYEEFKTDVSPKLHQRHFIQKPVNDDEFLDQVYSILY